MKLWEIGKLLHGGDYNVDQWLDRPDILVEDIRLMKSVVGDKMSVKASTGINNRAICDAMIEAGAVRMGTSKGIRIVEGTD